MHVPITAILDTDTLTIIQATLVSGTWEEQRRSRTLPALETYTKLLDEYVCYALWLLILALFLNRPWAAIWTVFTKSTYRPKDAEKFWCRGYFCIASLYLLCVCGMMLMDLSTTFGAVVTSNTYTAETWTDYAVLETIAMYLYNTIVPLITMVLAPFALCIALTWILTCIDRRFGPYIVPDYVKAVRFNSAIVVVLWAMLTFHTNASWPMKESTALTRVPAVSACFGSAVSWLAISHVFNFGTEELARDLLEIGVGGVARLLRMFRRVCKLILEGKSTEEQILARLEQELSVVEDAIKKEKARLAAHRDKLTVETYHTRGAAYGWSY